MNDVNSSLEIETFHDRPDQIGYHSGTFNVHRHVVFTWNRFFWSLIYIELFVEMTLFIVHILLKAQPFEKIFFLLRRFEKV